MRSLLLLFLLTTAATAQEAATLRPFVTLEDAVVRLDDLFDGLGARGEVPLGPAPPPGQRLVVGAAQLYAIAQRNNVAWRPSGGADSVVLERPGRAVTQDEVTEALRHALRSHGVEEAAELELLGFTPPLVPPSALPQILVEQAHHDAASGRFGATLLVMAEGVQAQRMRVSGRAVTMLETLVSVRRMAAGDVVREEDVRLVRLPANRLRPGSAERMEQVLGQALRRPVSAGQAMLVANLSEPLVLERGATVTMRYRAPGLVVTATGRAMQGAARGEVVPVMNLGSRIIVEARAVGPGQVEVEQGR